MTVRSATRTALPPSEQFRRFGGTALGLLTAQAVAERRPRLWVAPFGLAALAELADTDRPPRFLTGHEVVVKPSGTAEAFSLNARRGAHDRFPRPTLEAATTWRELAGLIGDRMPAGTVALVAQRLVTADGWPDPVIVHADGIEVLIEFADPAARSLARWTPSGGVEHACTAAGDAAVPPWCEPVARLHHELVHELEFPVDTEGVVGLDGRFGLVKLRPLPAGAPVDPILTRELAELRRRRALTRETPFVWGAFDVTLPGIDLIGDGDPRVLVVDGPPARQAGRLPGRPVLVDLAGGFHLSHHPDHLPPPGPVRAAYRYIGLPGLRTGTVIGRTVRLLSDGRRGGLVLT